MALNYAGGIHRPAGKPPCNIRPEFRSSSKCKQRSDVILPPLDLRLKSILSFVWVRVMADGGWRTADG